ncbi:MAG: hypothetical protein ACHQQ3_13885, partial [Gemmatimonadales bacterium]
NSGFSKVGTLAHQAGGGTLFQGACLRDAGKPDVFTFTFLGAGLEGTTYTLEVEDNGVQGLNGTIDFNGTTVVTHPMLGGNAPVDLLIPVTIATDNSIVCKLEGKPGSGVSIFVNP